MKKYIYYIGLVLVSSGLFSCNKDSFNYKDGYVGRSKITYYPSVVTNGDHLTIIAQGDTYTDAGAKTTLNGADYKYQTTGTVDSSTPGMYYITYSAENPDGYSASDTRTVVVIGNDVAAHDYSGVYKRTSTGINATWKKIANGVYTVDNPGGAVGVNFKVTIVNYTGSKIAIPKQPASDGSLTSSASESTTVAASGNTLTGYSMEIVNAGYGTAIRTFIKQ